ncbi:MAG: hypothetical protein KGL74_12090 [Elusimicrobia bacterium]|nr:hypothetical protein [Elusimicrobiota bacterium]
MNTPLSAVAVAFTLCSAGFARAAEIPTPTPRPNLPSGNYNQGTTADGQTIVAAGTYGPFQGPTCEAGSAGCTPAAAAAGASLGGVETPLDGIGKLQQAAAAKDQKPAVLPDTPEIQATEDKMKASGIYKDIQRNADGTGAVITLPDGSIAYSDYVKGFDTMPKKPEDIVNDPNAPDAMKKAAQKILDAKNPDKMQAMSADSKMFNGSGAGGKPKAPSVPPTPAPSAGSGNTTGDTTPANPKEIGAWMADNGGIPAGGTTGGNMGGNMGGDVGGSRGGSAGSDGTPSGQPAPSEGNDIADQTSQAAEAGRSGRISTDGIDVIVLKKNIDNSTGIRDLEHSAEALSKANAASGDAPSDGKVSRGSTLFGR